MPRPSPALPLVLGLLLSSSALAGSGPWVIGEGQTSVYLGSEFQRFGTLSGREGKGAAGDIAVDDGIESIGFKGILTYGIRDAIELDVLVPWYRVEANRPGGAVCASLGPQTCATTEGLGNLEARVKGLLVDELVGAPVSLAAYGTLRLGQFTAPERARVTNLGEGTTDIGGGLAIGRSGGFGGGGTWSAHVDTQARHRFSNVAEASPPIPGWELLIDAEAFIGARRWWSLGPSLTYFNRPQGLDVEELLARPAVATDIDRFARLNGRFLRAGGKALIRSSERTTFVAGASWTLAAVNNPSDVFSVNAGITIHPRRPAGGKG